MAKTIRSACRNKYNKSIMEDNHMEKIITAGVELTLIYEDDRVRLLQDQYGRYIEVVKQSLEETLRANPDEDTEEAIDVLRTRGLI